MSRIAKMPLNVKVLSEEQKALLINQLLDTLYWISPVLNPEVGQVEPWADYLRAGLIAYADGSNWDPGTTVYRHVYIYPPSVLKGPANPPGETTINNTVVHQFDAANDEDIYFTFRVPENWVSGTDLNFQVHWAPTDGNAGNVIWAIDYRISKPESNEAISGTDASLTVTDAAQSLQDEHLQSGSMTIPNASIEASDEISIRFYRDADNASDTYGADASLIFIDLIYTANNNEAGEGYYYYDSNGNWIKLCEKI